MTTNDLLRRLLEELEAISKDHEEIFDTEVRERMGIAVVDGFVRGRGPQVVPIDLGMASDAANGLVHSAIVRFVNDANNLVESVGKAAFFDRLAALQNRAVSTDNGNDYEEFFGHTPPAYYDVDGNVIRTQ
jgi:hypothetical protein